MTLRPIAPHEVVVMGDKRRLANWPARIRSCSPPGIRQRSVSSPSQVRGDIVGGVGGAGRSRRHGHPRKFTYSLSVTFSNPRGKQGSVTFSSSNQVPQPTPASGTPRAGHESRHPGRG